MNLPSTSYFNSSSRTILKIRMITVTYTIKRFRHVPMQTQHDFYASKDSPFERAF